MIKDKYYYQACEDAKEDWMLLRIQRTDEDVERKAEKLRKQSGTNSNSK